MVKTNVIHPIFKPNIVRYVFLAGDIFSFIIQSSGGGLSASKDPNNAKTGKYYDP